MRNVEAELPANSAECITAACAGQLSDNIGRAVTSVGASCRAAWTCRGRGAPSNSGRPRLVRRLAALPRPRREFLRAGSDAHAAPLQPARSLMPLRQQEERPCWGAA